jgi:hypothetical protein
MHSTCLLTSRGLGCGSQPVVRDKDTTYEALYRIPCDPLTVKPCACTKQCVALANVSFTPDRPCKRKSKPAGALILARAKDHQNIISKTSLTWGAAGLTSQ